MKNVYLNMSIQKLFTLQRINIILRYSTHTAKSVVMVTLLSIIFIAFLKMVQVKIVNYLII